MLVILKAERREKGGKVTERGYLTGIKIQLERKVIYRRVPVINNLLHIPIQKIEKRVLVQRDHRASKGPYHRALSEFDPAHNQCSTHVHGLIHSHVQINEFFERRVLNVSSTKRTGRCADCLVSRLDIVNMC